MAFDEHIYRIATLYVDSFHRGQADERPSCPHVERLEIWSRAKKVLAPEEPRRATATAVYPIAVYDGKMRKE